MIVKRLLVFLFVIFLLGLLSVCYPYLTGKITWDLHEVDNDKYQFEKVFVMRVIDGDTIEVDVNRDREAIRMLGINSPEKGKPDYQKAKNFLKRIENQTVEILRDREDTDKYQRKLRYVFYNNRLLNTEILELGLATSFMINDLKYEEKLKRAENYARDNRIGLWGKSFDKCSGCIDLVELNFNDEYFILRNICDFNCDLSDWAVKDDANHFFELEEIVSMEQKKFDSKGNIWNNDGDRFFMRDGIGKLVLFYEY